MESTERLRAARRAKHTLRSLAPLVGVSRQALLDYEKGRYAPTQEIFEKLKRILELDGEFSDYFVPRKNLKYTEGMECAYSSCTESPAVKGMCKKHYYLERRKNKSKKS